MNKEIFLEPVGMGYRSFKKHAKVLIDFEEGEEARYVYTLVSYGEKVLIVSISIGKTISVMFRTTQNYALGKTVSRTTARHLSAFLNFVDMQSGQPIKQRFMDTFKGRSLLSKMNFVPYVKEGIGTKGVGK